MLCLSNEVLPIVQCIVCIDILRLIVYIFNHVIQWHFSTSWVVTYGAALTLQSQWFKFCVECATHYVCFCYSLSVLRQCHCSCCCSLFSLFTILFDFLDNINFVLSVFLILIQMFIQLFYYYCAFVRYFSTKHFILLILILSLPA